MDINNELNAMANAKSAWFDAKAGVHKVKVLKEPIEQDVEKKEFKNKKVEQITLLIKTRKEGEEPKELNWSVTKGKTLKSLWGKLCVFAKYCNNGNLSGKEFTLIVQGEGLEKEYTISESLPFLEKAKQEFKMPEIKDEPIGGAV